MLFTGIVYGHRVVIKLSTVTVIAVLQAHRYFQTIHVQLKPPVFIKIAEQLVKILTVFFKTTFKAQKLIYPKEFKIVANG